MGLNQTRLLLWKFWLYFSHFPNKIIASPKSRKCELLLKSWFPGLGGRLLLKQLDSCKCTRVFLHFRPCFLSESRSDVMQERKTLHPARELYGDAEFVPNGKSVSSVSRTPWAQPPSVENEHQENNRMGRRKPDHEAISQNSYRTGIHNRTQEDLSHKRKRDRWYERIMS